jgi:hypothetical protein
MKYEAKVLLIVSCANDAAAKIAVETLKRFLNSGIVRATLVGYGIELLADPIITIEKKKP